VATRFEWDEDKNQRNLVKHDVRFETAALVFDDPYALTRHDESMSEEGTLDHSWIGQPGYGALCRSHLARTR
jgi:uncharacterized DUF497 family protein